MELSKIILLKKKIENGIEEHEEVFSIVTADLSGEKAAQFMFHFTNDNESALEVYGDHIHPTDLEKYKKTPYIGTPMSVGDIVDIDHYYGFESYLCLSRGWEKVF